uniref:LuxR regulatory protein n=1 Tax=Streptomyces sp. CNB091 TaxID=1169156 RepID=A0A2P2CLE8_9ACTN|nr:TPA_exp: LuxR regulatory protein [Streptomyces sp. CNB091]
MTMNLFERDDELRQLRELFTGSLAGAGALVLVTGPPASGKTELIYETADFAVGEGAVVLEAQCLRSSEPAPLDALSQLLAKVGSPVRNARADRLLEEARTAASHTSDRCSEAVGHIAGQTLDGLCEVVLGLAAKTPVLMLVDDVQFADMPSLQFLLHLAHRSRSARLMIVLAERAGAETVHPLFRAGLLGQPHYRQLPVGPLSVTGVEALLAEGGTPRGARPAAEAVHAVTGGNPLLTRALLQDSREAGAGDGITVGTAYQQAVLYCVHRDQPGGREVAGVAAVLGDSAHPELIARILDRDDDAVERALSSLEHTGLMTGPRFRHPAAREAVLADLTQSERAGLQLRAARALDDDGASSTTVALHLLSSGYAQEDWAQRVLDEAAEEAAGLGRPDHAAAFLDLAARACRDPRLRDELVMRLAHHEQWVNPFATARRVHRLTRPLRHDRVAPSHLPLILRHLFLSGRLDEMATVLPALDAALEVADPRTALHLRLSRLSLGTWYPAYREEVAADAGTPPDPRLRAVGALRSLLASGDRKTAAAEADAALSGLSAGVPALEATGTALYTLILSGRTDRAADWHHTLARSEEGSGLAGQRLMLTLVKAEIALRQDNPASAGRLARQAMRLVPEQYWPLGAAMPLILALRAAVAAGDVGTAAELAARPVPPALSETLLGPVHLRARGRLELLAGRPDKALEDFLACGRLMRKGRFDLPSLAPWRGDAAEACLVLGHRAEARWLAEEQLAMERPGLSPTRGASLRMLAAVAPGGRRGRLPEGPGAGGGRDTLTRTLAELRAEGGGRGEPQRPEPGTAPGREPALDGEREVLRRRPGSRAAASVFPAGRAVRATLTGAEERVAKLAALGRTNREIALELRVTASTVEQHLTRVYRKLAVTRRGELTEVFSR